MTADFDDRVEITLGNGEKTKIRTGLFLNNEFVKSISGKTFPTVAPSTGEIIADIFEADKADIDVAVENARKAFSSWRHIDGSERGKMLYKLADSIEKNIKFISDVETMDQGKTTFGSNFDIMNTVGILRCYAGWADKIEGKTMMDTDKFFNFTRHEPFGVTAGIIPWNYPLVMWSFKVGPAIATGNCIIMKSSEKTPLTNLLLGDCIVEAGFPPGVIQLVSGYGPTTGQAIVEHPKIMKVAFTGSGRTGRRILETASKTNLKKVSLELGGKSPAVVFEDADIDKAVGILAGMMFFNNGQTCVASSRVYVQKSIADKFVAKFAEAAKGIKVGNPFDAEMHQGPLVDDIQFNSVMRYIDAGKSEGKLVTGGARVGQKGFFLEPTVFTDVPDDAKVMREEIFGPVTCINTFETEDEVVERANNTSYGLAAGVFTKDLNRAIRVSSALEAGTIWVNTWLDITPQMPFGGYKESGIGRELGKESLDGWTQVKSVKISMA